MWLQRLTNYLLERRWLSLLLTFGVTFIPIIGIVGILFAGLVTLLKGAVEGLLFTLVATLPYLISFSISSHGFASIPLVMWAAIGVAVLSNLLTWVFAVMLLRQTTWSVIIQIAALLGVLCVSVIHLAYPNVVEWWSVQLNAYYNHATALSGNVLKTAVSNTDVQKETINITKQYATGLMTAAVLFNAIMQLIVARWWQSVVSSLTFIRSRWWPQIAPGLLGRELHNIRLSPLAGILFVCSLVLSYLGNLVVLDIMPILYMLFGAAGLSLIHYGFGLIKSNTAWFWLLLLYLLLIFSLPTSVVLLAVVALFDIWMDFRQRFRGASTP